MYKKMILSVSVITVVIIIVYAKYLTIGQKVYKLDKNVEGMSIPVTNVEDPSKLVTTVGDTSKPVTTVGDTSKPVATVGDTSKPVTTIQDTSMPVTNIENTHKIVSNLEHARFAICTTFWEQQTNALLNMWSFLKWAKFTGFRVFEPFAHHSVFEFSNEVIQNYNSTKALHFSDYIDLDLWTTLMKKHGLPPFEEWYAFAHSSLKRTVVVFLVYGSGGGGFVDDGINKHQHCKHRKEFFYKRFAKFFDTLQIEVVREVCLAFGSFTLHQFNSFFLLNNETHVWFTEWRGIEGGRMSITDHGELHRTSNGLDNILTMAKESPRVMKDARNYVNTILNTDFKKYTAVAFRATNKKTALAGGHSREYIMQYFRDCAEKVEVELLKNPSSIKFLSIDLGRLGDLTSSWYFEINNDGNKLFQFILNKVYGNKSIDEYENELIRGANGIDDSGYIGSMVKNIAENAGKLIVVGGHSNFQRSMIMNFQAINGNCQGCVVRICY